MGLPCNAVRTARCLITWSEFTTPQLIKQYLIPLIFKKKYFYSFVIVIMNSHSLIINIEVIMKISNKRQVQWYNDKLLQFMIKDFDAIEHITDLIEKNNFDRAFKEGNILIDSGKYIIAELLASELFANNMPIENNHLWHEYMNKSVSLQGIIDIETVGRAKLNNECGLWIVGHHKKEAYINHVKHLYDVVVSAQNVKYAFLEKKSNFFLYSKSKLGNMVPITTCLDEKLTNIA